MVFCCCCYLYFFYVKEFGILNVFTGKIVLPLNGVWGTKSTLKDSATYHKPIHELKKENAVRQKRLFNMFCEFHIKFSPYLKKILLICEVNV